MNSAVIAFVRDSKIRRGRPRFLQGPEIAGAQTMGGDWVFVHVKLYLGEEVSSLSV